MAKVLIVEDDPLMLRMYQRIFTFEKHEVEVAEDGEECLAKVQTFNPTIILLDIMMPRMNGLQALDRLKSNPATKNIPVVILTNLAGQQDAETALSKGAIKYIVKSEYDPKEVVDMVGEMIKSYIVPNDTPSPS
jgi:CheY-like chemotaxis protein